VTDGDNHSSSTDMKFQFSVSSSGRKASRQLLLLMGLITACLLSINQLHSLAVSGGGNGSSGSSSSNDNSKHGIPESLLGFLPVQLLQQEYRRRQIQQHGRATYSTTTKKKRKWAYAYLMAGVDAQQQGYRGILYNVLVAARVLQQSNTVADVVLMVQMASSSISDRLLPVEEHWLQAVNVTIKYLDLPRHGPENFYTAQLEKFHILEWHREYTRVIFMDGDVLPFCNLDYLFALSDPEDEHQEPLLRENLILAWTIEPAHGGFFMLAPKEGDFEALEEVVRRREQQVVDTGLVFDGKLGWGQEIEPRGWKALMVPKTSVHLWDFHGDFVDQGLLYYWTKYYKKDVSIVIKDQVENWSTLPDDTRTTTTTMWTRAVPTNSSQSNQTTHNHHRKLILDRTLNNPFDAYTCVKGRDWPRPRRYAQSATIPKPEIYDAPYRDFIHFTGKFKPWLDKAQKELQLDDIIRRVETNGEGLDGLKSPGELWYYLFWEIHQQLQMGNATHLRKFHAATNDTRIDRLMNKYGVVDIRNLNIPRVKLGGYPTYNMMKDVIEARTGKSLHHVEGWKEAEDRRKAERITRWKTRANA